MKHFNLLSLLLAMLLSASFVNAQKVRYEKNLSAIAETGLFASGSCPQNISVNNDPGQCGAIVNYSAPLLTRSGYFTQTADNTLTPTPGMCANPGLPISVTEASYIRVYDLPAMGLHHGFSLTSFEFGIRQARTLTAPSQPVNLNVYSWDPATPLDHANFTLQGTQTVQLANQVRTIVNQAMVASIPAGKAMILEVAVPDGSGTDRRFIMGGSFSAQSAPSYIKSPCSGNELVPLDSIPFEDPAIHWVINAYGNYQQAQMISGLAPGAFFPAGTTQVSYLAGDETAPETCSFSVTVNDAEAPVITNLSTSLTELWPVNHKMIDVTVNYTSTDNCPGTTCQIVSVTSNEPAAGNGINSGPDWEIVSSNLVRLRAARLGTGNGRTYTITISCTDASGNYTERTAEVKVPKSQGMIKARMIGSEALAVQPNPAKGTVNVLLPGNAGERGLLLVTDLYGRTILKREILLQAAGQTERLDMSRYSSGQYLVSWQNGQQVQTEKFILND